MNQVDFEKNVVKTNLNDISAPYQIKKAWLNENSQVLVILMDPNANTSRNRFLNLIAYNITDPKKIMWSAELPTNSGPDCYTDAEFTDMHLTAFSFSCFRCIIDWKTGKLVNKNFAK